MHSGGGEGASAAGAKKGTEHPGPLKLVCLRGWTLSCRFGSLVTVGLQLAVAPSRRPGTGAQNLRGATCRRVTQATLGDSLWDPRRDSATTIDRHCHCRHMPPPSPQTPASAPALAAAQQTSDKKDGLAKKPSFPNLNATIAELDKARRQPLSLPTIAIFGPSC